jgi:adenylate kinase family enzyme
MMRLHLLGASGTGTTTLSAALASELEIKHLDSDDYFWLPDKPRFSKVRNLEERIRLLDRDTSFESSWVLSGSMIGWGDFLIQRLDAVVFLQLEPEERMRRLVLRERQRYGESIFLISHPDHARHQAFLDWAQRYDTAGLEQRSLVSHKAWIRQLECPVLELDTGPEQQYCLETVLKWLSMQSN